MVTKDKRNSNPKSSAVLKFMGVLTAPSLVKPDSQAKLEKFWFLTAQQHIAGKHFWGEGSEPPMLFFLKLNTTLCGKYAEVGQNETIIYQMRSVEIRRLV